MRWHLWSERLLNFLIIGFLHRGCAAGLPSRSRRPLVQRVFLMRRYVVNATVLAAGISIAIAVVTALFCRQILILIRTPENILDGAYWYLIIIFIGIPFTVLYNLAAGIPRSRRQQEPVFVFAISTIINIIGDLVCILVFGMGVEGAAISTIVAQAISGICCVIYMKKAFYDPEAGPAGGEAFYSPDEDPARYGCPDGDCSFHHCDRQCHFCRAGQHAWLRPSSHSQPGTKVEQFTMALL